MTDGGRNDQQTCSDPDEGWVSTRGAGGQLPAFLARSVPDLGCDTRWGRIEPPWRRAAARRRPRDHQGDRDPRTPGARLAVASPDGQRQGRDLHLRLDRQPVRSRHAQRRRYSAAVPGSATGRRVPVRIGHVAGRGTGAGSARGDPGAGVELGADLLHDRRRRPHPPPAQEPDGLSRQSLRVPAVPPDDQRVRRAADGAQDASRDQTARRDRGRLAWRVDRRAWRSPVIWRPDAHCQPRPTASPTP